MKRKHYSRLRRKRWRWWVTPKPLADKPVHRWCVFPHSFTSELVHALIEEWGLGENDKILDPFAGAGTTLLASKEKGIPAVGYDLSPLAVLASQVKVADYNHERLVETWGRLRGKLVARKWNGAITDYPELVRKALPGKLLPAFHRAKLAIGEVDAPKRDRDFFRLALLGVLPKFSRAVAAGGWLKWVKKANRATSLVSVLSDRVEDMLRDLEEDKRHRGSFWGATIADARLLPDQARSYSALITSPPYPNRHDYTRVFGVELMFLFLDWEGTRKLRYQTFHSHPEARPNRPKGQWCVQPHTLTRIVARIRDKGADPRVPKMIEGYFLDLFLCLREVRRVCKRHARIAFVMGNAQYSGVAIPVDELTAQIGEQAGLSCEKLITARYRGNSAQQMGRFGRRPSRESIVVFRRV